MIRFFNNIKNEEKFMAIVNCIKKIVDFNYEGYDVSDPLDEMNDFMDSVPLHYDHVADSLHLWFREIYDRWMGGRFSELSVEAINKSFEAAFNGKHYYDAINILDAKCWDKDLVEYVLTKKADFIILSDKDDYEKFLYKYSVMVKCPNGYHMDNIDLWRPAELIKDDVADSMKNCVINDCCENDDGEYEDYEGNAINVEEEAARYAEEWLAELDYEEVNIEYYN